MIRSLISLPYELARLPLVVVDSTLAARLPESSLPRATLHWAMGSADQLAGALLGNHDIAQRGADRVERSEKLRAAARLEEEATARTEQARETAVAGREEAERKREAAQDRAASGLKEAEIAEARGKEEAADEASEVASAKQAAADQRAASRKAKIEQEKARVDIAAEATRQADQREVRADLDDAHESSEIADDARVDAERLADLVEAKKQDRLEG